MNSIFLAWALDFSYTASWNLKLRQRWGSSCFWMGIHAKPLSLSWLYVDLHHEFILLRVMKERSNDAVVDRILTTSNANLWSPEITTVDCFSSSIKLFHEQVCHSSHHHLLNTGTVSSFFLCTESRNVLYVPRNVANGASWNCFLKRVKFCSAQKWQKFKRAEISKSVI